MSYTPGGDVLVIDCGFYCMLVPMRRVFPCLGLSSMSVT